MSKIPQLDELRKRNAIPNDTKVVKDFKNLIISYSEFKKLYSEGKETDKIPALDNPVWVGQSKRKGYTYSCNSEGEIGRYSSKVNTFVIQELNHNKNKLSTIEFVDFKRKEDFNMANLDNMNVEDLMKDLDNTSFDGMTDVPNPEAVEKMNAFDGAPAVDGGVPDNTITETITANLEGAEFADADALGYFNQGLGRMVLYVTQNSPVLKFGTSSKPKKDNEGNKILLNTAPVDIKTAFNNGDKRISSTYFEKVTSLTVKQAAPGKILGAVVSIPVGGDVDILELKGSGEVSFDKNKKDLVYKLLNKDELNLVIATYFNGTISESKETFGEFATKLHLQAKIYTKPGEDGEVVKLLKQKLVPENRNKNIVPGAFFPVKEYATVKQSELTPELCDVLNKGTFQNLFKLGKEGEEPKANLLNDIDRQKVRKEGDKIVSSFFTANVAEREQLEITPFWMKVGEGVLDVVEIPVKMEVEKKDGTGMRYPYKVYSSLDKQVLENTDYKAHTPLFSGKYERELAACHGAITEESLRRLTARKTTGGKKKDGLLDAETTRKLLLQSTQSGLNGIEIEGGKRITVSDLRDALTQM